MDILNTVILGVATVFIGLVCIIILVEIMHAIYTALSKGEKKESTATTVPTATAEPTKETTNDVLTANRGEVVAAIAAVIAEDLGRDVKAIRIKSIKRI